MIRGFADDAPDRQHRSIRQTVHQVYEPVPRQIIHAPEVLDLPFAKTAPYESRGRTIKLFLNHQKATNITATSATFNINLLNVGRLMPGSRIRPVHVCIAAGMPSNGLVIVSIKGIIVKDSVYADGTPADLQFIMTTLTNANDYSGTTIRPEEILNLDCLVGNTFTVTFAPDVVGTMPSLTSGFSVCLQIEEPVSENEYAKK